MERSAFGVEHEPISKMGVVNAMLYGGMGRDPKAAGLMTHAMHGLSTAKKVKAGGLGALKGSKERRLAGQDREFARMKERQAAKKQLIATPLSERPRFPKGRVS